MCRCAPCNPPAAIPSVLGPADMPAWHLDFSVPQAEFIWGMAGADLGLDNGSSLYTFTRNYTLEAPAVLKFLIFADDHCDVFLNNRFLRSFGIPWLMQPADPAHTWDVYELGATPAGDLSFVMRCSNALGRGGAGVLAALTDDAGNALLVTNRDWRVSTGDNRVTISPDDIAASK